MLRPLLVLAAACSAALADTAACGPASFYWDSACHSCSAPVKVCNPETGIAEDFAPENCTAGAAGECALAGELGPGDTLLSNPNTVAAAPNILFGWDAERFLPKVQVYNLLVALSETHPTSIADPAVRAVKAVAVTCRSASESEQFSSQGDDATTPVRLRTADGTLATDYSGRWLLGHSRVLRPVAAGYSLGVLDAAVSDEHKSMCWDVFELYPDIGDLARCSAAAASGGVQECQRASVRLDVAVSTQDGPATTTVRSGWEFSLAQCDSTGTDVATSVMVPVDAYRDFVGFRIATDLDACSSTPVTLEMALTVSHPDIAIALGQGVASASVAPLGGQPVDRWALLPPTVTSARGLQAGDESSAVPMSRDAIITMKASYQDPNWQPGDARVLVPTGIWSANVTIVCAVEHCERGAVLGDTLFQAVATVAIRSTRTVCSDPLVLPGSTHSVVIEPPDESEGEALHAGDGLSFGVAFESMFHQGELLSAVPRSYLRSVTLEPASYSQFDSRFPTPRPGGVTFWLAGAAVDGKAINVTSLDGRLRVDLQPDVADVAALIPSGAVDVATGERLYSIPLVASLVTYVPLQHAQRGSGRRLAEGEQLDGAGLRRTAVLLPAFRADGEPPFPPQPVDRPWKPSLGLLLAPIATALAILLATIVYKHSHTSGPGTDLQPTGGSGGDVEDPSGERGKRRAAGGGSSEDRQRARGAGAAST